MFWHTHSIAWRYLHINTDWAIQTPGKGYIHRSRTHGSDTALTLVDVVLKTVSCVCNDRHSADICWYRSVASDPNTASTLPRACIILRRRSATWYGSVPSILCAGLMPEFGNSGQFLDVCYVYHVLSCLLTEMTNGYYNDITLPNLPIMHFCWCISKNAIFWVFACLCVLAFSPCVPTINRRVFAFSVHKHRIIEPHRDRENACKRSIENNHLFRQQCWGVVKTCQEASRITTVLDNSVEV